MLIIRGVNIFPRQIEELIVSEPGLSAHYRIDVRRDGAMDALSVTCEAATDDVVLHGRARAQISHRLKSKYGLSAEIVIVDSRLAATLRGQGKARVRSSQGPAMKLECDRGGSGPRLLVLLHGLGATRHVWTNFVATGRWNGSWIAPDLRGHGASAHASDYSLNAHAADIAGLARDCGEWNEVVALGHSMGGAIAMALASGAHGIAPAQVFGLGIKVAWNDDELTALRRMAAMPVKFFATKDEAAARYLKVSGLSGLIAPDSRGAIAGVIQTPEGWRLACDPAAASVGAPPMKELVAAACAPVHLARGTMDALVSHDQLAMYDSGARDLPGGHNAMVENPGAVWDWIDENRK